MWNKSRKYRNLCLLNNDQLIRKKQMIIRKKSDKIKKQNKKVTVFSLKKHNETIKQKKGKLPATRNEKNERKYINETRKTQKTR